MDFPGLIFFVGKIKEREIITKLIYPNLISIFWYYLPLEQLPFCKLLQFEKLIK